MPFSSYHSVRAAIVDAVMDLQEVQWDDGVDDWDALAEAARAASKDADQEAVRTAWEDMTVAKQAYSREFLIMCPRPDPAIAVRPRRGYRMPRPILKKPVNPLLLPPSAFLLKEPKRARSASRTRRPTRESQKPPSRRGRNDQTSLDNSRHRSRSFGPLLGRRLRGRGVIESPPKGQPDDMSSTLTATSTSTSSTSTTTGSSPMTVKKPTFSPLTHVKGKIQLGNRPPTTNSGGTNIPSSPKSTVVNHNNTLYSFHVRKIASPKQQPSPNPQSKGLLNVIRSPSQPKRRGDSPPTPIPPSPSSVPTKRHHALPRSPSPSLMLMGGRPKVSAKLLPPGPPLVNVPSSSSSSRRPRQGNSSS